MAMKSHISSLRKQTGSKGCNRSHNCYQIKASCLIKNYRGGFVQTEPYQRDQVRSKESYIGRQLSHNGPVLQLIPGWKYHQGWKNMTVKGNGGTLEVTHKETLTGYKKYAWFIKDAITNIISLKNLIKQYRVTYDSIYQILVVHREDNEKPNMEFKINESGIHCYNQTDNVLVLINDVSQNKQRFSKSKINGAEQAKTLYAKLGYPSVKYFRWIVQSQ